MAVHACLTVLRARDSTPGKQRQILPNSDA
jgi:hypothetical protein